MALPHFVKALFDFHDGEYGWTEQYFLVSGATELRVARDQAGALADARVDLLGAGPDLRKVKVGYMDIGGPGLKYVSPFPGALSIPVDILGKPIYPSEVPWSSLLLRFESAPNPANPGGRYRGTHMLSGVPDSVVINPPPINLPGFFKPYFDAWVAILTGGLWGQLVLSSEDIVSRRLPNNSLSVAGATLTVGCTGHNFSVGDEVSLTGMRDLAVKLENGIYEVIGSNAGVSYSVPYTGPAPSRLARFGFSHKRVYTVYPYSDVSWEGYASRKRGSGQVKHRGRNRTFVQKA